MLSGGWNMINSFLHPERGFEEAEKESRRAWEEAQGYEKPYWERGNEQAGRLTGAEDKLLDPAALEAEWSKSYETSPYAKQLLEKNRTSGLDAASSMGLMGSSAAINNIQQGAGEIVAKDRQQYMQDLMNKYLAGIGIGQDIYGQGGTAAGNLTRGRLQTGQDLAQERYGKYNAPGQTVGEMIKALIASQGRGGYG